jgi:plastocyanin
MKTTTPITGALVVIVAAAGVAVGALALDAGGSPAPASTSNGSATTVQAPAANADSSAGDGYGSDTPSGNTDSGSGNGAATASPSAASSATLDISGFAFGSVSVAPGGKVTVQNQDSATHTVTADEGGFDTGQIAGGSSATFTAPTTPGTYSFHCDIHPDMTGTLTVVG